MRKFEIPYNFDLKFVDKLSTNLDLYRPQIEFIYLPCWEEDGLNTRMESDQYKKFHPKNRFDYEEHIKKLNSLGLPLNILFQHIGHETISLDTIKYYESLGVHSFTTDSDQLALKIKDYNPDLCLVASVTKLLTFSDYLTNDLSMYDYSVLDFPFERGLDAVRHLPTTIKYMIIINNFGCVYNCPRCLDHWKTGIAMCNNIRDAKDGDHYKCGIYPKELVYFDDYIDCYKIAGRELSTDNILSYVEHYLHPHPDAFFRRKKSKLSIACQDGTMDLSKMTSL